MLVGQNKEIDLAVGALRTTSSTTLVIVSPALAVPRITSAIDQDAVGIGARLTRERDQEAVAKPVPVHPDFRTEAAGRCGRLGSHDLRRARRGRPRRSVSRRRLMCGCLRPSQRSFGLASQLALVLRRVFCRIWRRLCLSVGSPGRHRSRAPFRHRTFLGLVVNKREWLSSAGRLVKIVLTQGIFAKSEAVVVLFVDEVWTGQTFADEIAHRGFLEVNQQCAATAERV